MVAHEVISHGCWNANVVVDSDFGRAAWHHACSHSMFDASLSIPTAAPMLDLTQEYDVSHTPSPIEKSSSLSPPNAPSKTPSTKYTSSTFGTTSSFIESKPCFSPFSSINTPSPQPTNPLLDDPLDAPPRPSNLLPL
ncbi:hypothetical protein Tco_0595411 [Tanacetum coccineum]